MYKMLFLFSSVLRIRKKRFPCRSNPTQNIPIDCRKVLKPFSHTQTQLNYFVSTNMSSFLHWTTVLFGLLFTMLKDTQYNPDLDFMKSQVQIRNKKVQIRNKKGPDPQQKGPDPKHFSMMKFNCCLCWERLRDHLKTTGEDVVAQW